MSSDPWNPGMPDRRVGSPGSRNIADFQAALAEQAQHLAQVAGQIQSLTGAVASLNDNVKGLVTIYNTGAGLFTFLKIAAKIIGYISVVSGGLYAALHWLRWGPVHA